jgi:hypothetical protein
MTELAGIRAVLLGEDGVEHASSLGDLLDIVPDCEFASDVDVPEEAITLFSADRTTSYSPAGTRSSASSK